MFKRNQSSVSFCSILALRVIVYGTNMTAADNMYIGEKAMVEVPFAQDFSLDTPRLLLSIVDSLLQNQSQGVPANATDTSRSVLSGRQGVDASNIGSSSEVEDKSQNFNPNGPARTSNAFGWTFTVDVLPLARWCLPQQHPCFINPVLPRLYLPCATPTPSLRQQRASL